MVQITDSAGVVIDHKPIVADSSVKDEAGEKDGLA